MLEERIRQRSIVRTCIMRKRVSFAFFKQWYWDCFDEDVQVCVISQLTLQAHVSHKWHIAVVLSARCAQQVLYTGVEGVAVKLTR